MRLILFVILTTLLSNSYSQTLISDNSWFLAANSKLGYIFYFKSDTSDLDEYPEGQVFIYDKNKKKNFPLNSESYILNFLKISWSIDNNTYFMSSGTSLDYYSFISNEKGSLYLACEDGIINNFSVSNNGNFIIVNEKIYKAEGNIQTTYLIDRNKGTKIKILEIGDFSIGESLKNNFLFDLEDENIFIMNILGELTKFNIKSNTFQKIGNNLNKIFCINNNNLYYQKNGNLIQYNYKNQEKSKIIEGETLDIQYVNTLHDNIVVNFNDNVFLYDEIKGVEKIQSLPKGEYVYIKNGFAVEKSNNNLYLHSLVLK